MASYQFAAAYTVLTTNTPAGKEQNSSDFNRTTLGTATISDDGGGASFSGNDVVVTLTIGANTYYGWISRPIKSGGVVKGFYFWKDNSFTTLGAATADGNQDTDGNVADNSAFVLAVDTAYFAGLASFTLSGVSASTVGSSSDRVDSSLNSLTPANAAPSAVADSSNLALTAGATGGPALESGNGVTGANAVGNVLTNDTDTNAGDTKTVTAVGVATASNAVNASTTSANGTVIAGQYGSLTLGADGSYSYAVNNSAAAVQSLRQSTDTLSDVFTYKMVDSGGLSATTTLTVRIQGSNDAPSASIDYATAKESITAPVPVTGYNATGNVLTNDTDVDGYAETKTVTGITGSATGLNTGGTSTLSFTVRPSSVGVGDFVYDGSANGVGDDNTNKDSGFLLKTAAGENITVSAIPTGTNTFTLSGTPSPALTANQILGFATNDSKAGYKEATISSSTPSATTTVNLSGVTGTVAKGMTLSGTAITVTGVTYDANGNVTAVTLSSATSISGAVNFTASAGTELTGRHGKLTLGSNGSYTYTPTTDNASLAEGQSGVESFNYTMQDAAGVTSTSQLRITVYGTGGNDPVATPDVTGTTAGSVAAVEAVGAAAGTNGSGNVVSNDSAGAGSSKTVSDVKLASAGSSTAVTSGTNSTNGTAIAGSYGTLTIGANGTYSYVVNNSNTAVNALNAGGQLTETFVYTLKNGLKQETATTVDAQDSTTLTVAINGANDAPVAASDTAAAVEAGGTNNGTPGTDPIGNVLNNDSDVDHTAASLKVSKAGTNTAGTSVAANSTSTSNALSVVGTYGTLTLGADGSWKYTVDQSNSTVNNLVANSTALTDTFSYEVSDPAGSTHTATLTVSISGAADVVAVNDVFVNEASPQVIFKVTGSAGLQVSLALGNSTGLATTDAKATLGTDLSNSLEYYDATLNSGAGGWASYTAASLVSIPAGGTLLVRMAITADTTREGNESFTLDVTSGGSLTRGIGTIGDEGEGAVFINGNTTGNPDTTGTGYPAKLDDDRVPTIANISVTEAGGHAEFTVSGFSGQFLKLALVAGTATVENGVAPVATDGSEDFGPGLQYWNGTNWIDYTAGDYVETPTSGSLRVRTPLIDDTATEDSESFSLRVTNVSNVNASGTATIAANDVASANIAVGSVTVSEASPYAVVAVTLSVALASDISFTPTLTSGTATVGTDTGTTFEYNVGAGWVALASGGTVTFTAGLTSMLLRVAVSNDAVREGGETLTVATGAIGGTGASGVVNAAGGASGTVTVVDDGSSTNTFTSTNTTSTPTVGTADLDSPGITVSPNSLTTAEAGTNASFTVVLTSQPTANVTVTITGLNAGEGSLSTTPLTFTAANWNVAQTVTVTRVDDTVDDGDISYTLTATSSSTDANYSNRTGTVSVTNTDDDNAPSLSISDLTVGEAAGTATLTVTRSGATGGTTTVNYATGNGTGSAPDYTAASGTLTFAPGETSKSIVVNITNDSLVESSETVLVTLSGIADATSSAETIAKATGTITITDNDVAGITLSKASLSTAESGTNDSFTVVLTSQPTANVTVTITGLNPGEGSLSTTTLTFTAANWNTAQTVTVTRVDDTVDDGDISYTLTATTTSTDTNYSNRTGTVSVTNTDNDAPPSLSISDATVSEADGTATLTVTRSGATGGTTTVNYATADITATYVSADYTYATGSLSFAPGETSKSVVVSIPNDTLVEPNERFAVVLSGIADATSSAETISDDTGVITVTNDDVAGMTLSAATLTTAESGTNASFTVVLTSQPAANVTVTITGLNAGEGSLSTATLTFTAANWNTAQTVTVTGVDDTIDDGNISYTLTATSSSTDTNYSNRTGTVSVTNTDNDDAPSLAIAGVTVGEAAGTATLTVTRTGATGGTTTVNYATSDGTATSGSDYTAVASTSLSFAPGETSKSVVVNITNDSLVESSETVLVTLSGIADATSSAETIATATGTITITDNDAAGLTLSGSPLTTAESGTNASFTVVLTSQPTANVTVTITGLNAGEGSLSTATLTFTAANWNTAQTVTVTRVDDTVDDGDISYTLTATTTSTDTNYSNRTGTVSVTNTDNDDAPSLSISGVTVGEGAGTATLTVTRSGATGGTTTVNYATGGGTATSGSDYTAITSTSLSFAPGDTSKSVVVSITDDSLIEASETLGVTLSGIADPTSSAETIATATGTITITDNDVAGLTLSPASLTTAEFGTQRNFTVVLTSQPTADVTVTISGLDATEGSLSATTLTFTAANWNTAQTVTVTGVNDTIDDGNITYTLTATSTSTDTDYSGRTGTVSVTNTDDDDAPSLSISDVTVNEGGGTATLTVTRSGATGGTTTVDYATANGTATSAGGDYTSASGSLSFAPGETSKSVVVNITNDSLVEASETLSVNLSGIADATSSAEAISDNVGQITITDNDVAGMTLSASSLTTRESGANASFTVALTSQPTADVTVTISGLDGTEGSLSATTLTFTAANWNTAQTVTVAGADDTIFDGDIGYTLTATSTSSDSNYSNRTGTVSVTNIDDDSPPSLSISDATVSEGAGSVTLTVTRSGATGGATSVNYATGDGSANAADYTGASGSLSFAPGETEKTIVVGITNDALAEASETLVVNLSGSGDAISKGSGQITITDNDAAGMTLGAGSLTTTESGTSASFTVVLTSQPAADVTVTISGLDDTEGSLSATTLSFTAANWNTAQTVTVTRVDDTIDDGDIVYTLTVTSSSADANYNGRSGTVSVTNTDDDSAPSLSISDATVSEAAGTATLTVTRSGATGGTTTVNYATGGGTAGAADYAGASGSLSFAPGETSKTIVVGITEDAIAEAGETLRVTLSGIADPTSSGEAIAKASGEITITDNDVAGMTLSAASLGTAETGTNASFAVVLTSQPTADVSVTISGLDDTEGSLSATTLSFTAANWNAAQTVTVAGVDDTLVDGAIDYTLTASSSSGDAGYSGRSASVRVTNTDNDVIKADLDPTSDTGESDRVTEDTEPDFTIEAPNVIEAGGSARLVDPSGNIVGNVNVTPQDVASGSISVSPGLLDDGAYTFTSQILDAAGKVVASVPVVVTVVTDRDGVMPSVELAANNGDFNNDGIPDWLQNNVAQLPIISSADFELGKNAPSASFGAVISGTPDAQSPGGVKLDRTVQLIDVRIDPLPEAPIPEGFTALTDLINFTVEAQTGAVLNDVDPARAGLQTQLVVDLPNGVRGNAYLKFNGVTKTWVDFTNPAALSGSGDGAALVDTNGDGRVDRIVITLTDGGPGDEDGVVNGSIVDPGALAFRAGLPVYFSTLAHSGERLLSTVPTQANPDADIQFYATAESGPGTIALKAWYNPLTGDWFYGRADVSAPYECYVERPEVVLGQVLLKDGGAFNVRTYLNEAGVTQIMSAEAATALKLLEQGYVDLGDAYVFASEQDVPVVLTGASGA